MQAAAAWCRIEWVYFKPFGLVSCVGGMFTFQARRIPVSSLGLLRGSRSRDGEQHCFLVLLRDFLFERILEPLK